ncbi:diadenosine 5',5'''-P1,P4-tetraphosphate asymmetrical hydrolase [Fomitiporia mediterranea MF3/22]|uniref:diadenosine 5',5'''-P1,P4-tetraphosphate asymmetrical hydrolase n=1 Tax=Fomitiporia mediterranea (strain MF3/22) TaxID=694068 RepID=UPI0004408121|nr:diadenosine 5',5'''-P1,P4-tetraphosphate asymmetrical hydrolase [Fomitiporia mediterranea MF3/22]EJC98682.1 diadenosine 5',5'''-P1,P4-tetraphosphate asymmetrical hydrolase [Fomitiporia mediterranea MF3/22]
MNKLLFSTIDVTRQAFYRTAHAFAIVNLKPIVPGHVLVIPTRVVPRLSDLSSSEVGELFTSVQLVGRVVERAYGADSLTIACQDGLAAGQSIPHVHVHVLPRKLPGRPDGGDAFSENNDAVYPALEDSEHTLPRDLQAMQREVNKRATKEVEGDKRMNRLKVDADDERPPRTVEEMVREAEWLHGLFEGQSQALN